MGQLTTEPLRPGMILQEVPAKPDHIPLKFAPDDRSKLQTTRADASPGRREHSQQFSDPQSVVILWVWLTSPHLQYSLVKL